MEAIYCPKCGEDDQHRLLILPADEGEEEGAVLQCQTCQYIFETRWQDRIAVAGGRPR